MSTFSLFSDGGGEKNSSSCGACILDSKEGREKYLIILGPGTNNEGEIMGALLGFALICKKLIGKEIEKKSVKVNWVSDSEYALKSGTQYINNWQKNSWRTSSGSAVKNKSLWKLYLELTSNFEVKPTHVRGHSGHPENEACDKASTWGRTYYQNEKDKTNIRFRVKINDSLADGFWNVIDYSNHFQALRERELDFLEFKQEFLQEI